MLTPSTSQQFAVIPSLSQDISTILTTSSNNDAQKNAISFASLLNSSRSAQTASSRADSANSVIHKKSTTAEFHSDSSSDAASAEKDAEAAKSAEHDQSVSNRHQKSSADPNSDQNFVHQPNADHSQNLALDTLSSVPTVLTTPSALSLNITPQAVTPLVPAAIPQGKNGQQGAVVTAVSAGIPQGKNGQQGAVVTAVSAGIPQGKNGQQGAVVTAVSAGIPQAKNGQQGAVVTPVSAGIPQAKNGQQGAVVTAAVPKPLEPVLPMDSSEGKKLPTPGVGENASVTSSTSQTSMNPASSVIAAKADISQAVISQYEKVTANVGKSQFIPEANASLNGEKPDVHTTSPITDAESSVAQPIARTSGSTLSDLERMQTVGKFDALSGKQNSEGKISISTLGIQSQQVSDPLPNDRGIQPQSAAVGPEVGSPLQDVFIPVTAGVNSVSPGVRNEMVSLTAGSQLKIESPVQGEINTSTNSVIVNPAFTGTPTAMKADTQTSSDSGGQSAPNRDSLENVISGIGSGLTANGESDIESTSQTAASPTTNQLLERTRIVDQVTRHLESMKFANGKGEITLQLQPAHLGSLRVSISKTAEGVVARIVTESAQVQQAMQGAQELLRAAMESKGLTLDKFQITLHQNSMQNGQSAFQGMYDTPQERASQRVSSVLSNIDTGKDAVSDAIDAPLALLSNSTSRLDYRA